MKISDTLNYNSLMIELASVLFILLLFVFPVPASVIALGFITTRSLHKKYAFYITQPVEGKRIQILTTLCFLTNFILSTFLGVALAWGVDYLIYENIYLLIFNFMFCFSISLRWFDYTYYLYRLYIFKLKPFRKEASLRSQLVICQGFREQEDGGLTPVFIDAGTWECKNNEGVFKGVFYEKTFNTSNIIHVKKKSSEKIKIVTHEPNLLHSNQFLIILKEQFHPFKSQKNRDKILKHFNCIKKTA